MALFQGYWDQKGVKSPAKQRRMTTAYTAFTTEELSFIQKSHTDLTTHYSRAPSIEEIMYYFYSYHNTKKSIHDSEGSTNVAKSEVKKWLEAQGLQLS
ncbi:hypothetical protein E2P81_ATG10871 [Venturia nashicola]|uniref:Uncharacterized protein n=1 Tax=Venturia nashicola TaxID=86259 RepID=A0A4Z1NSR8_9PEZI|nr:hypothetical protein E6O75_ATG10543 [Venturia nashicola]TLD27583.1 hypothetical protein E2P81_ATG10871 [Venturia nashicola]